MHRCQNDTKTSRINKSMHKVARWNTSITNTIGNQNFVRYTEIPNSGASGVFLVGVVGVIALLGVSFESRYERKTRIALLGKTNYINLLRNLW